MRGSNEGRDAVVSDVVHICACIEQQAHHLEQRKTNVRPCPSPPAQPVFTLASLAHVRPCPSSGKHTCQCSFTLAGLARPSIDSVGSEKKYNLPPVSLYSVKRARKRWVGAAENVVAAERGRHLTALTTLSSLECAL